MNCKPQRSGVKYWASVAAVSAVAAFGLWKGCQPSEGPAQVPSPPPQVTPACPAGQGCVTPPRTGDSVCEVLKGEDYPPGPTFDQASCGYCGDGIIQLTASQRTANDPAVGQVFEREGKRYQFVTERSTETAQNCPADAHCGNGVADKNALFGAWVPVDHSFGVGTLRVQETHETCPEDVVIRRRPPHPPPEPEPREFECSPGVAGDSPVAVISAQSVGVQSVLRLVTSTVSSHAEELRSALNVPTDSSVVVKVTLQVDENGHLAVQGASAKCNGSVCGDNATLTRIVGLGISHLSIGAPGAPCVWTIPVSI